MTQLPTVVPIDKIRFNEKGLVPAIAQDYLDGTVLMMAWMNADALQKTMDTGEVHYWSRSRQELWHKGATSGHFQKLKSLRYDCDSDALLVTIEQIGDVACHTGERSCFHQVQMAIEGEVAEGEVNVVAPPADTLSQVYGVINDRKSNPKPGSYTNQLFEGGDNKILQKIGEEAVEVVMACKDDEPDEIAGEVADLLYHTLVAIAHHNVDLKAVYRKLQSRR
ncbi:MAG: bifunctional phosphoribosyl-AMP cyclohydrolase/phosphoribosyl-ATP diphosphatase HisIE [Cyanobacteria bacterium P01_A01_bin.116]